MSFLSRSFAIYVFVLTVATLQLSTLVSANDTESSPKAGDMHCIAGSPFDPSVESKITRMEFWYGVECTENNTDFLRSLESTIYQRAFNTMSWCYQYGGRRMEEAGESYVIDRHDRRLGIMTITSGPRDWPMDNMTCPQELRDPSNFCSVILGTMSFTSHATDDLSMSIDSIRTGIKHSMESGLYLSRSLPTVVAVTYLGDSVNDVYTYGQTREEPVDEEVEEEEDEDDGRDRDIVIPTTEEKPQQPYQDGKNRLFLPIIALGIVGTGFVGLLLLAIRKKRRAIATQRELDGAQEVLSRSDDGSDDTYGDPEGAFHQGYYHYTRDGVRYLSPYCDACRRTERQLSTGHSLETISEDEQFLDSKAYLVSPNSKDIGGMHSTMDVHACQSAMCTQCHPQADVQFFTWNNVGDSDNEMSPRGEADNSFLTDIPSPRSKKAKCEEV